MSKPRYCPRCGSEVHPEANRCYLCNSPLEKQRSPVGAFFIALLKCLGFYGFFSLVRELVATGAIIISTIIIPDGLLLGEFNTQALERILNMHQGEIGIISTVLIVAGYAVFMKLIKKSFKKEIRLSPAGAGGVFSAATLGVAALFAVSIGLSVLYSLFPSLSSYSNSGELSDMMESGNMVLTVLNVTVFTGIVEEILFRGLIYNTLKKAIPTPLAVFMSAIIFGAAHMNIEQFFYTALLGALLCFIYDRYDSIIPPIILHASFNGANYILGALDFKYDMPYFALFFISAALIFIVAGFVFFTEKAPAASIIKTKGN